jgi:thiol-disulfide isomerase/thioredoxin
MRWLFGAAIALGLGTSAMAAAPGFDLPSVDGQRFVRLDDFRGRPLLINFWSSRCPACLAEWPLLQDLRAPKLSRLGIALDRREDARNMLKRIGSDYPQALGLRNGTNLLRRFGNHSGALPYTVVLDARHRICARRLGAVDPRWIKAALKACS